MLLRQDLRGRGLRVGGDLPRLDAVQVFLAKKTGLSATCARSIFSSPTDTTLLWPNTTALYDEIDEMNGF